MKDVSAKNLPEITEVTLLSLEEFKACKENVNFCDLIPEDECDSWYLRTPADEGEIWVVIYGDELDEPDCVDFEDSIALGNYDIDVHNPEGTGTYIYSFIYGINMQLCRRNIRYL